MNDAQTADSAKAPGIGDNSGDLTITIEARLFNSLAVFGGNKGTRQVVSLPVGATVGELARRLGVPTAKIFLVLQNGRDVTRGLVGDPVNLEQVVEDGDVIALSGPVPYSYGFGAPVV